MSLCRGGCNCERRTFGKVYLKDADGHKKTAHWFGNLTLRSYHMSGIAKRAWTVTSSSILAVIVITAISNRSF